MKIYRQMKVYTLRPNKVTMNSRMYKKRHFEKRSNFLLISGKRKRRKVAKVMKML
uniref:50S ribosomal protein L34 n=1 Tax=Ascaris lumbricoides TaxID=6252 RepID=A0A0M3HGH9_ASCLU